jgi:predicted membrane-bound dolichyl-phosphate-mannose-protein mannosyltransferase
MGPYQPLAWMSLALDHAIWGLRPAGYHLSAMLWHAAAAVLLYSCLSRLYPKSQGWVLISATLFWAIHPLRVESVVWATERRDVMSGFFTLLAWRLYLSDRRLAIGSYLAGMLSKATAVGTIWLFLFKPKTRSWTSWVRDHAVYLGGGAAICVWGAWGLQQSGYCLT